MTGPAAQTGPAPLHDDVSGAPAGGVAAWLDTDDGVRIRAAAWGGAASPRGTVLMFPGRTEYIEKYGALAGDLTARGFAFATVDWRGQGLAGRMHPQRDLGHVVTFRDYQRDVAALLAFARARALPEPFYLIAHSMGGCIGLRALIEGLPVRAAVFSAPMWGIALTGAMRAAAWGLSTLARPLGLSGRMAPAQAPHPYVLKTGFEDNTLTTDRAQWDRLGRQITAHPDLALGGPSLRWLNEALVEMRGLSRRPSPPVRARCWLGTDERIVDPGRIHDRMGRWPGGALTVVEGGRHEILMERAEIRDPVLDGIEAHFR
ncbi:alpha/beta fold hydrolase [Wenxinia saemankumensis]|uniref:Lysophospholipase n=1 Tax=Wenxinia saemankumensis TaxID=1447782 RepID=A0A1M6CK59_9RHOB|nr:alpha/beta hydrolase [Wenxinia saemankumensis]SHI61400.1 lysophospholipase [Wenxinia saemankumensis]